MRHLLDTHTLIWSLFSPEKLSTRARKTLLDPENEIYVSAISFWEISLKCGLGKLRLKGFSPEELPKWALKSGFEILDLEADEAASFHQLPKTEHKDPFDRMLIWQSIRNQMVLITKDSSLKTYEKLGLKAVW